MSNFWRRAAVVGASMIGGAAYVGGYTLDCWAKEPSEFEPAPLGAVLVASTATTSASISTGAFYYAPNMTGDEPIKVVQEKWAQIALSPPASSYRYIVKC